MSKIDIWGVLLGRVDMKKEKEERCVREGLGGAREGRGKRSERRMSKKNEQEWDMRVHLYATRLVARQSIQNGHGREQKKTKSPQPAAEPKKEFLHDLTQHMWAEQAVSREGK